MKTQIFENGTRILTLNKVVDTTSKYTYTHFFTIEFVGIETDEVAINMNNKNDIASWLEDNCDIQGTDENVELFNNLLQ
jgi:hypothetical protein